MRDTGKRRWAFQWIIYRRSVSRAPRLVMCAAYRAFVHDIVSKIDNSVTKDGRTYLVRSALVHYWLTNRRGGESVLEAIGTLLPDADLVSNVISPEVLFGSLKNRNQRETFVGKLPFARTRHQMYLPLMPLALEMLDMSRYELIVSSEAGPAKWVIPDPDAYHVCYCHSPLRYLWDQKEVYLQQLPWAIRPLAHLLAGRMRASDVISSSRVDQFIANSAFVARRVNKFYRRDAQVIYPPVDVELFRPTEDVQDFYLLAGEIRAYKRPEIAVQACSQLRRRLVVIGGGAGVEALRRLAGPTVEFWGRVDDVVLRRAFSECRALLFPGTEDFGIIPVEVMASGRPVVAYAKGGATETVEHGVTGLLYGDGSVEGLKSAIRAFEAEESAFSPEACVLQASQFSRTRFLTEFADVIRSPAKHHHPVTGRPRSGKLDAIC